MYLLLTSELLAEIFELHLPIDADAQILTNEFFTSIGPAAHLYAVIDGPTERRDIVSLFSTQDNQIKFAGMFAGAQTKSIDLSRVNQQVSQTKPGSSGSRLVSKQTFESFLQSYGLLNQESKNTLEELFGFDSQVDGQVIHFVVDFTDDSKNRDIIGLFSDYDQASDFAALFPTSRMSAFNITSIDEFEQTIQEGLMPFDISLLSNGDLQYVHASELYIDPWLSDALCETEDGVDFCYKIEGTYFAQSQELAIEMAKSELAELAQLWAQADGLD